MEGRPLLIVLGAVFTGMAALLTIAAAVTGTWLVLMAALPLAVTAAIMWYQGTGRLAASLVGGGSRRRRRRRRRVAAGPSSTREHGTADDDPWEDPFRAEAAREARTRERRRARRRTTRERAAGAAGADDRAGRTTTGTASADAGGAWRDRGRAGGFGGPTRAEAYDVLGLDPSAGEDAVRAAYREKAKVLHPDTEGGSAEAFQELNDAYERLLGE